MEVKAVQVEEYKKGRSSDRMRIIHLIYLEVYQYHGHLFFTVEQIEILENVFQGKKIVYAFVEMCKCNRVSSHVI
jgi:hypothetical protein